MPFGTPRRTILSVDDDEVNQIVIASFLEGAGYQVVQAMNGEECLDYLQRAFCDDMEKRVDVPDLVFLDVIMPGKDGFSVCREIRNRFPSNLPVIMISARMTKEDVIKGLVVGMANDYLTKPFDRALMLAKIETHIGLNEASKSQAALVREDFCSRLYRRLLPVSDHIPVGLISLRGSETDRGLISRIQTLAERGIVSVIELQFGHCMLSCPTCDELVNVCLELGQKVFCFVMSPDRDLFRLLRLAALNTSPCVSVTERFFSFLSETSKLKLSANSPRSIEKESDLSRAVLLDQLACDIDCLSQVSASVESTEKRLVLDKRKYALMRQISELEARVTQTKGALSFETTNLDAVQYRLAKAKSYRSDLAKQLNLVEDVEDHF